MSDKRPGRGSDQFILRFPEGMRDAIKDSADSNGRSMNAEIISRLEASLSENQENSNINKNNIQAESEIIDKIADERKKIEFLFTEFISIFSKLDLSTDKVMEISSDLTKTALGIKDAEKRSNKKHEKPEKDVED